jgi:hypothetical protein
VTTCARSASAALRVCAIGYFQPDKGQFGCISCDILGDYYQELSAQSSCVACPPSTKRFIGALTAATQSSCQCKEGDVSVELALLGSMDCDFLPCRLLQQRGPVRTGTMLFDAFGSHNELLASVHLAPLWLRFPQRAVCIYASTASLASVPRIHPLDLGRSIVNISICRRARSVLRAAHPTP